MDRATTTTTAPSAQAQPTTPFQAAVAAFKAAEREAKTLSRAHDAAQAAAEAASELREIVPPPAELTEHHPPITLVIEGVTKETEAYDFTYRTERSIIESTLLSEPARAAKLAAFAGWKAAQAESDQRTGYAEVARAVEEAHRRWFAAYRVAERAGRAVLATPAAPTEAAIKRRIVRDYFDGGDEASTKALLDAAASAPVPPAPPTTPSRQTRDDAELIAMDSELSALIEEEARRQQIHCRRIEDAHAAVDAETRQRRAAGEVITSDATWDMYCRAEAKFETHSGDADVEALHAEFDRLRDRVCIRRATTLEALRLKARLAVWYDFCFDPDNKQVSSLIRDVAAICGAPAPDYTAEDYVLEYQDMGGQVCLGVGGKGLHVVYPPEPSTRADEIEAALRDPELAVDLRSTLTLRGLVLEAPEAVEDALASARPEDREPAAGPFDPAAATETLRAAGVEVWPGIGFLFPAGLGPDAQQALTDLSEAEKGAVIDYAAAEAVREQTRKDGEAARDWIVRPDDEAHALGLRAASAFAAE